MPNPNVILMIVMQCGAERASFFDSIQECMEGICKIYEKHLRRENPNDPTITYGINQLLDFIDQLQDIVCLVNQQSTNNYDAYGNEWIKNKIFVLLTQRGVSL